MTTAPSAPARAARHCNLTERVFKPRPAFRNRHLQTLWPGLFRRRPRPRFRREILATPDGDFLDIDWLNETGAPPVVLLHGLEGSSRSPYIRGLAKALAAKQFCVAVMHFRGCGGRPNQRPRGYHSGETGDLNFFIGVLRRRFPGRRPAAVGFSLGGNVLLRYLARGDVDDALFAAAAVSVPFDLAQAADNLRRGFARFYQWWLLRAMKRSLRKKFRAVAMPFPRPPLRAIKNFRDFDNAFTAPLHGFAGAEDYYRQCGSAGVLHRIRIPTLLIQARDDPFTGAVDPGPLAPCVRAEFSRHGGHAGFVAGNPLSAPCYWLDRRIADFLLEQRRHPEPRRQLRTLPET